VELHVEESGRGDPLLLMPGVTEGIGDLGEVRDELTKYYRVIGVDLPGSGQSMPIPRAYTKAFYEEDAKTMATLLDERGIRSARIAGFSDGGEVALLLAARRPDLVRAVVSWGAIGAIVSALGPVFDRLERLIDDPPDGMKGWSADLIARYGRENARNTMRSWTGAARELLLAGGDISLGSAHAIQCPVLLIAGDRDSFCPPDALKALAERIPSVELIVLEGVRHSVHQERTDWFIPTVTRWLAAH
jgi:pimeloyl-ACP methyl ester carboxylesterase